MEFKELSASEFVALFLEDTKRGDLFFREGTNDVQSTKINYIPKVENFRMYKFYQIWISENEKED